METTMPQPESTQEKSRDRLREKKQRVHKSNVPNHGLALLLNKLSAQFKFLKACYQFANRISATFPI